MIQKSGIVYRLMGGVVASFRLRAFLIVMLAGFVCSAFAQQDLFETNNTYGSATVLLTGTPQAHTIWPAGDVDWLSFTAQKDHEYEITTYATFATTVDTRLTVYDSDGITALASDDDSGADLFAMLTYTATKNGTLYIKVNLVLSTSVGNYGIKLVDLTETGGGSGGGAEVVYGASTASGPAIATDSLGWPVVAYTEADSNGVDQVFIKRWQGLIGGAGDMGEWKSLLAGWTAIDGTPNLTTQVSDALGGASFPAVAVSDNDVYVAWMNRDAVDETARIYLAHWNGSQWAELGGSMTGDGISPTPGAPYFLDKDSMYPVLRVTPGGVPIIAFQQSFLTGTGTSTTYGQSVCVKRYDSASDTWMGMDGSTNGIVTGGSLAFDPSMDLDASGYPVVAWGEPALLKIRSRRWNGSSWGVLASDLGLSPFAEKPEIAVAPGGTVYLAWRQYHIDNDIAWLMANDVIQLNVVQTTGGSWTGVGTSYSPLGISSAVAGGSERPSSISIDVNPTTGYPVVAWQAGDTNNAIFLKSWNGTSWDGIDGSSVSNGISSVGGDFSTPAMTIDSWGRPAVVFLNTLTNGAVALYTYKVVGEEPPVFDGIGLVQGTANQVLLYWNDAVSPDPTVTYTSVTYSIYRSVEFSWNFAQTPSYTADQVFDNGILLATVTIPIAQATNLYTYSVIAADINKVWGFGVRAEHNGFVEANETIRYGGASNLVTIAPLPDYDKDNDGIDDVNDVSPNDGDGNDNEVSDGDELQAGWPDTTTIRVLYDDMLLGATNNFETPVANWTHTSTRDLWHRTTADPDPPTNAVTELFAHSTNYSFRCAKNSPSNDTSTTYSQGSSFVRCALDSPVVNPVTELCQNLIVSWNEFYDTEAEWDICKVAISFDGVNWTLIRPGVSGFSGGWVHRTVDATEVWRNNGSVDWVKIRFEFQTLNNINNEYHGWYVDDVRIYGTPEVRGKIRNQRGEQLVGAAVYAIGAGGVSNVVYGHTYVQPGKVFATALTDQNGDYELRGMPQGRFYIKAFSEGYQAEFWDGQLYPGWYILAFGNAANIPGVHDIRVVSAGGLMNLTGPSATATADFEMDPGVTRSIAVVRTTSGARDVYMNQTTVAEQIWNGTATPAGAALINYNTSIADTTVFPNISWSLNPGQPPEIADLVNGQYDVYLHPGWAASPYYSKVLLSLREGEQSKVIIGTASQTGGILRVIAGDGDSFPVYINGRDMGVNTPAQITGLEAGYHDVSLRPGAGVYIVPKTVAVSTSGTANVFFSTAEATGASGGAIIKTYDAFGTEISNASIYINGISVAGGTPVTVSGLKVGNHKLAVRKTGYMTPALMLVPVNAGITNVYKVTLRHADRDYDSVKDGFEVEGYTNLFLYDDGDDPDADGLSNLVESEQFRLHGLNMKINDNDSDDDGMLDGDELGYDGRTNLTAISSLAASVPVRTTMVPVYFQGEFLAGVNAFTIGRISIEGDEFLATGYTITTNVQGRPYIRFTVPAIGLDNQIVNVSHELGEVVFADAIPDDVDTDKDGMWDGYEFMYGIPTVTNDGINVIENLGANRDPDLDGLSNIREFLGVDGVASGATNSWSNPGDADSDDDGAPDGWEYEFGLNPLDPSDVNFDDDADGLNNLEEWQNRTDPNVADSDNDGLMDGAEVNVYGSDPLNYDTDMDGLWDGQEVYDTDLNPANGIDRGFFKNWAGGDYDNDGLVDGPTDWDTDGDGMPDGFEVLDEFLDANGMRIIRPEHERLDPLNSLDGTVDSDGDGLSNFEEYLVRDNLIGVTNGLLWDYSSNPFNPDSDDDGMPDGWEVWRGLHPQDPVPNEDSGVGIIIRSEDYWRYGDLDYDGLANIDEFDSRFVVDPNADPYAIEGSADPWDRDTDDDGLFDGEEVKEFRSSPVVQDSDGDGLIDGTDPSGAGRQGELNTSTNIYATGNYDRAMNDMWRCSPGHDDFITDWLLLQTDGEPEYLRVFVTNVNGVISIDVTNAPVAGSWLRWPFVAPPSYYWTHDFENDGGGSPGMGQGLLVYTFQVPTAGNYQVSLYNYLNWGNAGAPRYNSVWLNMDFGEWMPIHTHVGALGVWSWSTKSFDNTDYVTYLEAGLHYIAFSGYGYGYEMNRIHIYPTSVGMAVGANIANPASLPTATLTYRAPNKPDRLWGGEAALANYAIRDDNDGTFVGRPISGKGRVNQLLARANQFFVIGGRNGARFYDEIWKLKGGIAWTRDTQFGSGLGVYTSRAGCSQLVASQANSTMAANSLPWYLPVSDTRQVIRPRPGSTPLYRYYDGDRDTVLKQIWGENGVLNDSTVTYWTGWSRTSALGVDDEYVYYPYLANTKEEVLKWNMAWPGRAIPILMPDDDHRRAVYTWASNSKAYQYVTNGVVTELTGVNPTNVVYNGANLRYDFTPTDDNRSIVGINIDNVLNTIQSSAAGTLDATLNLRASSASTPFDVVLFAEVSLMNQGSSLNPTAHDTWSSDPEYGLQSQNALGSVQNFDFTPARRYYPGGTPGVPAYNGPACYRTQRITNTIQNVVAGDIISIDVTTLVVDILSRINGAFPGDVPSWELGNEIGFVLTPSYTNATVSGSLSFDLGELKITARRPSWGNAAQAYVAPAPLADVPFKRKNAALADMSDGSLLLFGGVDGNSVLDDTWVSTTGIGWQYLDPVTKPPARWGHGMATCNAGAIIYGGFDENNKPLDDTWVFNMADNNWYAITNWGTTNTVEVMPLEARPPARGGHLMDNMGNTIVVFGGTDGKYYMNDTWVLYIQGSIPSTPQQPWRWLMTAPCGERSGGPPPRAFSMHVNVQAQNDSEAAHAKGYDYLPSGLWMFGGRTGTLPTGKDSDNDWVDDGVEHALGGPDAGRDPRDNALIGLADSTRWGFSINTNTAETIPYAYKAFGGIDELWHSYELAKLPPIGIVQRGAIANFESLTHPFLLVNLGGEWSHIAEMSSAYGTPNEGKRTPAPTAFIEGTGYDAIQPQYTNLWWHPNSGEGQWFLGQPDGTNPPTAYKGRWCFGTDINNVYDNNSVLELYSPIFSLTLPSVDSTAVNPNGFYLVFHEWLDLADSGDSVRIECVRPYTAADVATRKSGTFPVSRPTLTILPDRNNAYNTEGEWRRVVVSLESVFNQKNMYLKFVLESDDTGRAQGWFIDDVAIVQAGEISGLVTGGADTKVYLYGVNSIVDVPVETTMTDFTGAYGFDGLVPAGSYVVFSRDGSAGVAVGGPLTGWNVSAADMNIDQIYMGITVNSPALLTWNSIPGETYLIQYASPASFATADPWTTLTTVVATGPYGVYRDESSDGEKSRYYRIILIQ